MSKGLFISATGTDIGKTYVTALIVKKLREAGLNAGYYKAALSGADCIKNSDAGFVNEFAKIGQDENTLLSYLYKNAVSPHLAAKIEGNPVEKDVVIQGYKTVQAKYDYVTVEGSGGIICPIRYDDKAQYFLEDIIKWLNLSVLLVADAGLGTINSVVLTKEYMQNHGLKLQGIILNNYTGTVMQKDNIKMIEAMTGQKVLALVKPDDTDIDIDLEVLRNLYE
ncbi:dethiobiotin synthase [Megamonas hypermegale]|uniref:dethiobiotin synthase n=1 Tax=Megamonas hypermegale TaxID=158847 RepID=UPI00242C8E66|nr:dethiobiotin synthase [Megamonas hypermegale]